jgi:isopentenyl-diphosphate delta-isomerase
VSFDDEPLILVDERDNVVGHDSKVRVHRGAGILHRAFSIFIVSEGGKVLLQQRSREKPLWPLYWSNSCCSHPRQGEEDLAAAHRRLREELGLDTELTFVYRFRYQAQFDERGAEHELCSVYVGRLADEVEIDVNPTEVAAWRWLEGAEVDRLIAADAEPLTPWFVMEWTRLRRDYPHLLPPA